MLWCSKSLCDCREGVDRMLAETERRVLGRCRYNERVSPQKEPFIVPKERHISLHRFTSPKLPMCITRDSLVSQRFTSRVSSRGLAALPPPELSCSVIQPKQFLVDLQHGSASNSSSERNLKRLQSQWGWAKTRMRSWQVGRRGLGMMVPSKQSVVNACLRGKAAGLSSTLVKS